MKKDDDIVVEGLIAGQPFEIDEVPEQEEIPPVVVGDPPPPGEESPPTQVDGCHLMTEANCLVLEIQEELACEAETACVTLAHLSPLATACPLIEGEAGDPVSVQLEASGGQAPYTFTMIESDIEDFAIDSEGVLTGTIPEEAGTYRYTFQVEDTIGQTDEVTCTLVIVVEGEDPPVVVPPEVPVTACGRLEGDLEFHWSHNSRVGPFFNQNFGEIFFIGRDPNDANRLILVKTTDFGETWAIADDTFASKTNDLESFDCHQVQEDHLLYSTLRDLVFISMQEQTTGRVSYAKVNLATATWVFTDKPILTSFTNATFGSCGITVTSTGDIGVLYQTDSEMPVSTFRARCGYKYSSDDGDTWSAELPVGITGLDKSNLPGRPVSDNAGRVQCFTGSTGGSWGEYWITTVRADHSVSTPTRWRAGSALSQIQSNCCMGDYCTFEEGGTTRIVYVCRMLFDARYTIFEASDDMIAPYQPPDVRDGVIGSTFNGLGGGTYEASYPQVSAQMIDARLHFSAMRFDNSVPTWIYHKYVDSPYAVSGLTPSGNADQSGPRFELSGTGIPGQEMAARVRKYDGELYHVSLRDSGTAGIGLIFNWIRLDQLPTSSGHTITEWAAECD